MWPNCGGIVPVTESIQIESEVRYLMDPALNPEADVGWFRRVRAPMTFLPTVQNRGHQ